jgi:uncharacterized repeat protein (TIGR03803 family)
MARVNLISKCSTTGLWQAGRVMAALVCAMLAAGTTPAHAQGTVTETVLHNFESLQQGAQPSTALVRDAAGNLYGTTLLGGADGKGTVYKVDTAGRQTVLYSFRGGWSPVSGVILDTAGNLYGTADGGSTGGGVLYKIDPAGNETVLYAFTGGVKGRHPSSGVVMDPAGNFYGTTAGTVYKVSAAGQETVLYSFTGQADGSDPNGVVLDASGNLYGTTRSGGTTNDGVVYKLDTAGNFTVLHTFSGRDGRRPNTGMIVDTAGNLYGTTAIGGTDQSGVVFKVDSTGQETVLHSFGYGVDGFYPSSGLALDAAGSLYGTTKGGGRGGTLPAGVVYKIDATGKETILYNFAGGTLDGAEPLGSVVLDAAGNLYGTTWLGGAANLGSVYEVDAAGQEKLLFWFPGGSDGLNPSSNLTFDAAGNLYGTTSEGGLFNTGTVFKVDAAGHESVLANLLGENAVAFPSAVVLDAAGNLYGTTTGDGEVKNGAGSVYKIDTSGLQTVLYSFTGGADGGGPTGVILDSAGNLYGAAGGGLHEEGVIFKLDPAGNQTVLYNFTGGEDGGFPLGVPTFDAAGNLYGTTEQGGAGGCAAPGCGTVYKLDPAGNLTVLYSFAGGPDDGSQPASGVTLDGSGTLYGTTRLGGQYTEGVVYKLDSAGNENVLFSFSGLGGYYPQTGVVLDAAGNVYGTSEFGGTYSVGLVYKVDAAGNQTVLHNFTGGADGGGPVAGMIFDSNGNLYGTTAEGGTRNGGVVYKLAGVASATRSQNWLCAECPW